MFIVRAQGGSISTHKSVPRLAHRRGHCRRTNVYVVGAQVCFVFLRARSLPCRRTSVFTVCARVFPVGVQACSPLAYKSVPRWRKSVAMSARKTLLGWRKRALTAGAHKCSAEACLRRRTRVFLVGQARSDRLPPA